jgi:predicted RNase H-like HicB family nuclease
MKKIADIKKITNFAKKKFTMNYTISIQKNKNGWLTGQCEQIPEAVTEGKDMDHLMKNMSDAIKEALDIRKEDFFKSHQGDTCIHRMLYLRLIHLNCLLLRS